MKIAVLNLSSPLKIELAGDEPWLDPIYAEYAFDGVRPAPLKGWLKFVPVSQGVVTVSGALSFLPKLACGRCSIGLQWDLSSEFVVQFRSIAGKLPKEKDLGQDDLDVCFYEGDQIDVLGLIHEQLELETPTSALRRGADGQCLDCGQDISAAQVGASRGGGLAQSPFAKLKILETK